MQSERVFDCPICGTEVRTTDKRKMFCTKRCADRSRNRVAHDVSVPRPGARVYRAKQPNSSGAFDAVDELRFFGKLTEEGKAEVLLGQAGFSVVMFDIEATHLKPNVGRILCCSFKPIDGEVYTLRALDPKYKERDVYDDGKLAHAIISELEKYDIVVGWNSKNFDVKFINGRAMHGGYPIKKAQYHVDGMWSWRSKSAAWSGLNNAQRFILPNNETEKTSVDWQQWMRAIGWDKALREQAMAEIEDHCERDVIVLEDVYRQMVLAGVVRSLRKDGGVL